MLKQASPSPTVFARDDKHHPAKASVDRGKRLKHIHAPKSKTAASRQPECRRSEECDCIKLEREGDPATRHAKVIVGAVHHIPAEITHPADMRGKANLKAGTNLAETSGFDVGVSSWKTNRDRLGR